MPQMLRFTELYTLPGENASTVLDTGFSRHTEGPIKGSPQIFPYDSAVMVQGVSGRPQFP